MPIDPRHNVLPGQRLRLAAEQVNGLNRLLRTNAGFGGGPIEEPERASNIVLVRNDSGADVPWLGVLGLGGPIISPVGGTLEGTDAASGRAREFVRQIVLSGVMPAGGDQAVGVAVEPIAAGAVGRVAVSGRFPAKIKILTTAHKYARGRAGDVTQLITAECGPLRVVWMDGFVSDGALAAVIG